MRAALDLADAGIAARVVSMPCVELFYAQDAAYRDTVLPPGLPRVSVEAGGTWFWRGVVGEQGLALGIDSFGESAPAEALYQHFGLTPAHVAAPRACCWRTRDGYRIHALHRGADRPGRTLVDSAPDIVEAANRMLADLGSPALPFDTVAGFIGRGVPNLVRRVLETAGLASQVEAAEAVAMFHRHYAETNGRLGSVFPGVEAGLEALRRQGYRLACVTNKPRALAVPLLALTGLSQYLEVLVAGDSIARMKPDPEPLRHACNLLDVLRKLRPSRSLAHLR